ncbi:MAG: hypothetical protein EOO43_21400 [Flavobacterium sp.]|nr:MAG: hypothetical protein EOO43_21400 [Flavobacterium sp.]
MVKFTNQTMNESRLDFMYKTYDFYVLVQDGEFAYNLTAYEGNQLWDTVADKLFNDTKKVQNTVNEKLRDDKELDDDLGFNKDEQSK